MAVGNRHGDQEESIVQSLLVLFCSQITLRTLLNKSHSENSGQTVLIGNQKPGHMRTMQGPGEEKCFWGDMMANCKDMKSFHSKEGLTLAADPDGQGGNCSRFGST